MHAGQTDIHFYVHKIYVRYDTFMRSIIEIKTILSFKLDQITHSEPDFIKIGSVFSEFIPDKHHDNPNVRFLSMYNI